ncbi:hypothetical protein GCM10007160_05600 [Litchfieldella qijiaojingensis]|uniref:Protein TonB n=1 Tax=Litchfieldella qijiaojingensis TaxID=980347 RepID=A0ABQ2YG96_9GAMM|nr:energy transducer TonB [Halomonas qijiaojingensis]GGX81189.1 hypothetical protein GCM10007160_05600 [Halomonas qijiaojingensis]
MRVVVAALGGVLLALLLFLLLALLVAPPEEEREIVEVTMSMAMTDVPESTEQETSAPAEALPPPPPQTASPPPAPMPAPTFDSAIALPEPEMPALETPEVELDTVLPEISEVRPEPEPQPQPEPQPEPRPEPKAEPVEASQPAESLAQDSEPAEATDSQAATSARVDGARVAEGIESSPRPTRRVPPEYPARAQRRGLEGYVEVHFTIGADGRVEANSIEIVEARPRNVFDRAARQAIARWEFPAGQPRRARQRLEFQLR